MKTKNIFVPALTVFLLTFLLNIYLFAQTTVVKGKLLDVNGNPSQYGLVGIIDYGASHGQDFVSCDSKGNYTIKLTKPGQNFLLYSIPSHSSIQVPVRNNKDKEVTINVTLAPYKYKDNFDDVGVAGSFNNFDVAAPINMTKGKNGIYTYEVNTDKKEVKYQLCNIEKDGRTINAPGSMAYEPDSSGDYNSIMPVKNGKFTIVFDPAKLLVKDADYKVTYIGEKTDEEIFNLYDGYKRESAEASEKMSEYLKSKKSPMDFHFDSGNYLSNLLTNIEKEKNQEIKSLMELIYVTLSSFRPVGYNYEKAATFYTTIKPANPAWDLMPAAFFTYYFIMPQYKWAEVQDNFLKQSKNNSIRIGILSTKLATAKFSGDENQLKQLHDLIEKDFPDVKEAQDLLAKYPIKTKIKVGAKIPDFQVTSMDNDKIKFSKKELLGKIYMIDFWATWCGPCVAEMDGLEHAYKKFNKKGFKILSLSMDTNTDNVAKFRKDRYKMEWMNAFIGDQKGKKLANKFEVIGIPKPILVGKDGTIIAMNADLRGAKLEQTLAKYFK